jgi:hypothetical protein
MEEDECSHCPPFLVAHSHSDFYSFVFDYVLIQFLGATSEHIYAPNTASLL